MYMVSVLLRLNYMEHQLLTYSRFLVLCGSHTLFEVNHISADEPIKTTLNFLLNNRYGLLNLQLNRNDNCISVQNGNAGIVIKHNSNDRINRLIDALMDTNCSQ